MPHIQFPSNDGTKLFTAFIAEGETGECEIQTCSKRDFDGGQVSVPEKKKQRRVKASKPVARKAGDESKFTIEKAHKFIRCWFAMMKEGAVSDEVYEHRKGICAGVEGLNPPCPFNKRKDSGEHYCDKCGCGERKYALLYVEGKPAGETERLYMPDPQCPMFAMRRMPGSGSLKQVGGRIKQMRKLLAAAKDEVMGKGVTETNANKYLAEIEGATDGGS